MNERGDVAVELFGDGEAAGEVAFDCDADVEVLGDADLEVVGDAAAEVLGDDDAAVNVLVDGDVVFDDAINEYVVVVGEGDAAVDVFGVWGRGTLAVVCLVE